jgi:putative peptidoglycan lipid II flippase
MQRVAFFVIPSAVGFLVLGGSIIALLYQTGRFTRDDVRYVWAVLAGYGIGLLAATLGRLYTSAFWALRDTRTPLRFAAIRVSLSAGCGWLLAFPVRGWLGIPESLGLVGLTLAAGSAAWVEFALLRLSMNRIIGRTGLSSWYVAKVGGLAIAAAAAAFGAQFATRNLPPLASGIMVLGIYGLVYFGGSGAAGVPEARQLFKKIGTYI